MHKAIFAIAGVLLLSGCNKADDAFSDQPAGGRYHGIGIFPAERLWWQMKLNADPKDPALAKLRDDEHVIVTMDARTGEIRQCGDHSGICVAMNPWDHNAVAKAPMPMDGHDASTGPLERASGAAADAQSDEGNGK